jgi:hypothetical protein
MCPETPEEDLVAWLERMEVPMDKQLDIKTFKDWLTDQIGIPTDAQVEGLWSAIGTSDTLADHGIYFVGVRENWGTNPRYAIQGLPGLWGWERVQEIMAEETEE